jgi:lon-related putative ATP-dependent protease
MIRELSVSELRRTYDPGALNCKSSKEFGTKDIIIGQERAVKALRFGLDIREKGFNIYVTGQSGTGRTTAIKRFLDEIAKRKAPPDDWVYVHNFEDSYRPHALKMPAGKAHVFKKDMENLVKAITTEIRGAFQGEQYSEQREQLLKSFEKKKQEIIGQVEKAAQENGFGLQASPVGILPVPVKNGKPLSEEDFMALTEQEREDIKQKQEKVQEILENVVRQTRAVDADAQEAVEKLDKQVVHYVLSQLMENILGKYKDLPAVLAHLKAVENNISDNIAQFKAEATDTEKQPLRPVKNPTDKYLINMLVDNSKSKGAAVIVEMNPTYGNLFGRIEQEAFMGALVTDFTLIRGGSLHRANGGYLVLPAEDVIRNPFTWESLLRCLRDGEISIEEPVEQPVFTAKSLRPKSIPLDVKVILIGSSLIHQLLLTHDEHFSELFKVKADFDTQMDRTDLHIREYAGFVCNLCEQEKLTHLDSTGLARVVEHGSRLAGDQEKLSTRFGEIADVIREANYYARQEKAELVTAAHIERAIDERFYRSALLQERIQEMIARDVIKIDLSGEAVGQANGLSVLEFGDDAFGQPSRITASVGLGKNGVINVEREAEMSGPTHTKGVMILSGYLSQEFAQDKPLNLNARLVFEQNYGGVDGDSASSTELYAILSALSGVPISQGIAVTGSVNQKGDVQAIGGVNEKIEGFFAVCKAKGLDGKQGVMIPASNVPNLMLKQEVLEAVQKKRFHVWAVDSVEDGIQVLTGKPAGNHTDGKMDKDGVFWRVDQRLMKMAEEMKKFNQPN